MGNTANVQLRLKHVSQTIVMPLLEETEDTDAQVAADLLVAGVLAAVAAGFEVTSILGIIADVTPRAERLVEQHLGA